MTTIGSQCEAYMLLRGLVDAAKEISRLEETIGKKVTQRDKLTELAQVEGYLEKVGGV